MQGCYYLPTCIDTPGEAGSLDLQGLVPETGLEPALITQPDPKSYTGVFFVVSVC